MEFHNWINYILIGVEELSWLETTAVFFGLASVYFSIKRNILVFLTGIISTLIYVWICFQVRLYADMGINAYYFSMSIYGWYVWANPKPGKKEVPVTWLNAKGWVITLVLLVVSYAALHSVLHFFTDSDVPAWDALTTSFAFVGMWLMAKKKVENWIAWILTDIISVPLYIYKDLPLTAFQFGVFTVMASIGLYTWIKAEKEKGKEMV